MREEERKDWRGHDKTAGVHGWTLRAVFSVCAFILDRSRLLVFSHSSEDICLAAAAHASIATISDATLLVTSRKFCIFSPIDSLGEKMRFPPRVPNFFGLSASSSSYALSPLVELLIIPKAPAWLVKSRTVESAPRDGGSERDSYRIFWLGKRCESIELHPASAWPPPLDG